MKKYFLATILTSIICVFTIFAGACSCSEVKVNCLAFEKGVLEMQVGDTIECNEKNLKLLIFPGNASNKKVTFLVTTKDEDEDGKKITVLDYSNKPTIIAKKVGVASIEARSLDGLKTASLQVRVYPKDYKLKSPTNIRYDAQTGKMVWDKQFIEAGSHKIDEVLYQVQLNGQNIQNLSNEPNFSDFEVGVLNKIKIISTVSVSSKYIKPSDFSGEVSFKVLNKPQNVRLSGGVLSWDDVQEAGGYKVVVYKKDNEGNLEEYRRIEDVQTTSCDIDIQEAGNFEVQVFTLPEQGAENTYPSQASNSVSIIKLDKVQTLTINNGIVQWNAVINAMQYNLLVRNKNTNTTQELVVSPTSADDDMVSFDLGSQSLISGQYELKVRTISNSSTGLSSEISDNKIDFEKLPSPTVLGVSKNSLMWEVPYENLLVEIKVGTQEFGRFAMGQGFTLPSEFNPGTYKIYMRTIGNGSNIITSEWFTEDEVYQAIKLSAPSTISHNGYTFIVPKVQGATNYVFDDVSQDYTQIQEPLVTAGKINTTEDTVETLLRIKNKVSQDSVELFKNRYTIKCKVQGAEYSNFFDSEYGEGLDVFKLIAPTEVSAIYQSGSIIFSFDQPYRFEYNAQNMEILNKVKLDSDDGGYYYPSVLKVYNYDAETQDEELFLRAISKNPSQLVATEMNDTSGGTLVFKIGYKGNDSHHILDSDTVYAKYGESNFYLLKLYEPKDLVANGETIIWDIQEADPNGDVYEIRDDQNELVYTGSVNQFDFSSIVVDPSKIYNFTIQNLIGYRAGGEIWSDSKFVPFEVRRLASPAIYFDQNYIQFAPVANADLYYIYINGTKIQKTLSAQDVVEGKIRFDYTLCSDDPSQYLNYEQKERLFSVVASKGADNAELYLDSYSSNQLTVRNFYIESINISNSKVTCVPTFNYDCKLNVTLTNTSNSEIYYTFEVVDKNLSNTAFEFEPSKFITQYGTYDMIVEMIYTGANTPEMTSISSAVSIQNCFTLLGQANLTYGENLKGEQLITWDIQSEDQGYILCIKDVSTQEVCTLDLSKNISQVNLTNLQGLQTAKGYQFAISRKGEGNLNQYNDLIQNSKVVFGKIKDIEWAQSSNCRLNSIAVYLEQYESGQNSYAKVGDIQDFRCEILEENIKLLWTAEAGIEYEIYVDEQSTPIASITSGEYTYTAFDKNTTSRISFSIRSKSADPKVKASRMSDPIVITVMSPVSNLEINGTINFTHPQNCNFEVEVYTIDVLNFETIIYRGVFTGKKIDLSGISALTVGCVYNVRVRAMPNTSTDIASLWTSIQNVQKGQTPSISVDTLSEQICIDLPNSEDVANSEFRVRVSRYENDEFITLTDSELADIKYFEFDNSRFEVNYLDTGKYKVTVVCKGVVNSQNMLYSGESNALYVYVLPNLSDVELQNENVAFDVLEDTQKYSIKIDNNEEIITTTGSTYEYVSSTLSIVGEHTVMVTPLGNGMNGSSNDFSTTFSNPCANLYTFIKLAQVQNVEISNGKITWSEVQNAQGYKVTFCKTSDGTTAHSIDCDTNSIDLMSINFVEDIYTFKIYARGDDQLRILSSEPVNGNLNLEPIVQELNLTLNASTKRFEWESVDSGYGYLVTVVDELNQESKYNVSQNYFALPQDFIQGTYTVCVQVKGDNVGIIDSQKSNQIIVTKHSAVGQITKSQSAAQDQAGIASICFDKVGNAQNYEIAVIDPNSVRTVYNYTYDESGFEYTFTLSGLYAFEIITSGNYLQTIDSNIQYYYITKASSVSNLQVSITQNNLIDNITYVQVSFDAQEYDISTGCEIERQIFNQTTRYFTNRYSATNSAITFTYFSNEVFGSHVVRVRISASYDNANYISSDWVSQDLYVYYAPTITKIENNNLIFDFDENETSQSISEITKVGIFVRDLTSNLIYVDYIDYEGGNQINLSYFDEILEVGSYTIGINLTSNSSVPSAISSEISFNKLARPILSIESAEEIVVSGNQNVVWPEVQDAVRYVVTFDEYITQTVNCFICLEELFNHASIANGSPHTIIVTAMGGDNTILSSSFTLYINQATTPSLVMRDGEIVVKDIGAGIGKANVQVNAQNFALVVDENSQIGTMTLGAEFAGDSTYKVKARSLIAKSEMLGDRLIWTVNSAYTAEQDMYKLPDVNYLEVVNGDIYVKGVPFIPAKDTSNDNILYSDGERAYMYFQVNCGGSNALTQGAPYSTDQLIKLNLSEYLNSGLDLDFCYRVVGDDNNLSSNYSDVFKFLRVNILDQITGFVASNGQFGWSEIANASGYKLYIAHDYYMLDTLHTCENLSDVEIKNSGLCDPLIVTNDTSIDMRDIFEYLRINSLQKDNINLNFDLHIKVAVEPMGSAVCDSHSVAYLNGKMNTFTFIKYATPRDVYSKNGQLAIDTSSEFVYAYKIGIDIEAEEGMDSVNNNNIFMLDSNYLQHFTPGKHKVRVQAIGDDVYSISSDISADFDVIVLDSVDSVYIENGFICFELPKSFFDEFGDVEELKNNRAFSSVEIRVGSQNVLGGYYEIDKSMIFGLYEIIEDSNHFIAKARLYSVNESNNPTYQSGFVDDLSEGLSRIQIVAYGNSKKDDEVTYAILNSNPSISFDINKLNTPINLTVQENVLTWDNVEGNKGYIIKVSGFKNGNENYEQIILKEPNDCSLNLIDTSRFLRGEYRISIRAIGDDSNLTSSSSREITVQIFRVIEDLQVKNGDLCITAVDTGVNYYQINLRHKDSGQEFEMCTQYLANVNVGDDVLFALPDFILSEENEKIYINEGWYYVKVKALGNGSTTINSEFSLDKLISKLPKVTSITSNLGKVEFTPVQFTDYTYCGNYQIKIEKEIWQEVYFVTGEDISIYMVEGSIRYAVDVPYDCSLKGAIKVSIRAVGNNQELSGRFSDELEAIRLNPVSNLNVNTNGLLIWNDSGEVKEGFKLVISFVGQNALFEHRDIVNNTQLDFPNVFVDDNNESHILSSNEYRAYIKVVGKNVNGIHYLSSLSDSIEVTKLAPSAEFTIENGDLKWKRVAKARTYELTFERLDGSIVPKKIVSNTGTGEYITYKMQNSDYQYGMYSRISIRALGGVTGDIKYVNSSQKDLTNIYKLQTPNDITLSQEVGTEDIIISFLPITYVSNDELHIINRYKMMVSRKVGSGTTLIIEEIISFDEETLSQIEEISYRFDDSSINEGSHIVNFVALAPEDKLDAVNSSQSEDLPITKPGAPKGLIFDNSSKCFTWNKPTSATEDVSYEIVYIWKEANTSIWYNVETIEIGQNIQYFYPPTLGDYKVVIRAISKDILKSDYVGQNGRLFSSYYSGYTNENILAFINQHGVSGSNSGLFLGGNGSIDSPYLINSVEHFRNMRFYCASGLYFKLNSDLTTMNMQSLRTDTSNLPSVVLASAENPFKAHFNGDGHTITFNSLGASQDSTQGIFAYCAEGSSISNLNVRLQGSTPLLSQSNLRFGLLCGEATGCAIENVTTTASLSVKYDSSNTMYIGGVVGYSYGNTTFTNVRNKVNITYSSNNITSSTKATVYVGGITAKHDGVSSGSDSFKFLRCINQGNLNGTRVGGIVAQSKTGAKECANVGNVIAYSGERDSAFAGGLIGVCQDNNEGIVIQSCFNRGNVQAKRMSQKAYIGGIVAKVETTVSYLTLDDVFNTGNISHMLINLENVYIGWVIGGSDINSLDFICVYYFSENEDISVRAISNVNMIFDNQVNDIVLPEDDVFGCINDYFYNSDNVFEYDEETGEIVLANVQYLS